jgi:peptide/nickel transport system permease protein
LDFGFSYEYSTPVRDLIIDRLPATFSLVIGAVVLWLAIGLTIGIASAVKQRSLLDRLTMSGALLAMSAPSYWLGLVALYLFSQEVGKIPIFPGSGTYVGLGQDPVGWFTSLILPWFVLAAAAAAFYARLLRASLIETMGEDYLRTARSKGLSERVVVLKHGVPSAITPVVTVLGLDIGILLAGVVPVETVFNIPGIGRLAFDAIRRADLPVIQGTVLFGALFIMVMTLLVDILYAFLDPSVRYE